LSAVPPARENRPSGPASMSEYCRSLWSGRKRARQSAWNARLSSVLTWLAKVLLGLVWVTACGDQSRFLRIAGHKVAD